jgi:uncharacterized protein
VGDPALPTVDTLVEELARRVDATRCALVLAPVTDHGTGGTALTRSVNAARRVVAAYQRAFVLGFQLARPREADCDFCSAVSGARGAVVNADGALYSCWETVGRAGYAVGDVRTGYVAQPPRPWRRCGDLIARTTYDDTVDAGLLDLLSGVTPTP